ncbi:MAG: type IX secretion system membrane protein PorP/SprF [Bacteroidetes bacterium]|nr:type IX secretion system membrane protein PorP/SprF [Bacteroidota bacterium]
MLFAVDLSAQDAHFSQFYANPMYLNPAFAGSAGGARYALNSRYQWPTAAGGDFQTYTVSYDQHFDAIGGGLGGQVFYDRAGDGNLSVTSAMAAYSYQLNLSDEFAIKAGIQMGVVQMAVDWNKFVFPDQIHPRYGITRATQETFGDAATKLQPDFAAGAIAYTDKYYGGFAVHHITQPNLSFLGNSNSLWPTKVTVHAGMMIPLDKGSRNPTTFVSPNILYLRQANFTQVTFGGYFIKEHFIVGMMYRQTDPNSDAIMAMVGAKIDAVKIGYSYDISVSDVRAAAAGSHEISLNIELPIRKRVKAVKWRKISCPDI